MNENGAVAVDLGELAEWVRREYGDQLPANPGRESHLARERRQEKTKYVLETDVMPRINDLRVQHATTPLTVAASVNSPKPDGPMASPAAR